MGKIFGLAAAVTLCLVLSNAGSTVAEEERPAFVIVERTDTTGPETIQQEYAKLAREILPKYAARYLARSQENTMLEGDGVAPCCVAILQFPNMDAVKRWYDSAENQEVQGAAKWCKVPYDSDPRSSIFEMKRSEWCQVLFWHET
jgi:uncharacterized protein (DUF1330 family)